MSAVALMDKIPLEMTLLLIVTSIVVLIFTLGHYYIEVGWFIEILKLCSCSTV